MIKHILKFVRQYFKKWLWYFILLPGICRVLFALHPFHQFILSVFLHSGHPPEHLAGKFSSLSLLTNDSKHTFTHLDICIYSSVVCLLKYFFCFSYVNLYALTFVYGQRWRLSPQPCPLLRMESRAFACWVITVTPREWTWSLSKGVVTGDLCLAKLY